MTMISKDEVETIRMGCLAAECTKTIEDKIQALSDKFDEFRRKMLARSLATAISAIGALIMFIVTGLWAMISGGIHVAK
jgi:hypothetical protein